MTQIKNIKVVLLIEPKAARDVIQFNIESKLGMNIIDAHSEEEVIGFLATNTQIDMVIIDSSHEWKNFFDFLKINNKRVEFLEIIPDHSKPSLNPLFKPLETIFSSQLIDQLPIILKKYFPHETNDIIEDAHATKLSDNTLCRIKSHLLIEASPLKSDIYIRLSDSKYIKLFHQGATFDKIDLDRYVNVKKIEYLYVKNSDAENFIQQLTNFLHTMMNRTDLSTSQIENVTEDTVITLKELVSKFGFTEEVQTLVKSANDFLVQNIETKQELNSILNRIQKNKDKYISIHSLIVAQIACSIAEVMGWKSDTTFKKITMAAILHDIFINDQEIAKISTLDELKKSKQPFLDKDINDFPNHPIQAAEEAKKFTELPADVDMIILQHHEQPDGSGFPNKLTAKEISPLASVFIVAHNLFDHILKNDAQFTIQSFIENRSPFYQNGNFKKIMKNLDQVQMSLNA